MSAVQLKAFSYHQHQEQDPRFKVVTTPEDFGHMMNMLHAQKAIAVDTETSGLQWYRDSHVVGWVFTAKDQGAYWNHYVPIRHLTGEHQLSPELVNPAVKQLLERPDQRNFWHNKKFDDHMCRREGITLQGPQDDTMILARLYNENVRMGLKYRALSDLQDPVAHVYEKLLDRETTRLAKAAGMKKKEYKNTHGFEHMSIYMTGKYGGYDGEFTYRLREFYEQCGVIDYYSVSPRGPHAPGIYQTEMELTRILCDMETEGIPIDIPYLSGLRDRMGVEKQRLEKVIWDAVGHHNKFELGKDDQLRWFLQERLGLRLWKRTKSGTNFSVDKEVLDHFADEAPVLVPIKHWREATKIETTYTDSILEKLDYNGLLHPDFQQVGTDCMPAGELVLTNSGYRPVEEVEEGDLVLTHCKRARRVVRTVKNGVCPVYKVTLSNGLVLRTTGNHAYRTSKGWRQARNLRSGVLVEVHSKPERWKRVVGWTDFEVSSWGRVRNHKTGHVLKQHLKNRWGHLKVQLYRNGAQTRRGGDRKDFSVHRLVAGAFLKRSKKPETRHLNGISWDNTVENLAWGTSLENSADAKKQGTTSNRKGSQAKLTAEGAELIRSTVFVRSEARLGREGSDRMLARKLGVSRELVRDVRLGKRWVEDALERQKPERIFATVVSVEKEDPCMTYGLTVEEDHSHVTGGIITHNTGRLSCKSPNAQNVLSDDDDRAVEYSGLSLEDGGIDPWSVKRGWICRTESGIRWPRLFIDYSQVELRVLAKYSMDPVMLDVYLNDGDIHDRTALEVFKSKEKKFRRPAKVINFGLCLAEGQRVLTHVGLVPIEKVEDWHLVWDGVEWVTHDGLICRGEQEVITYDGIEATPEHEVYTEEGERIQIGCLASSVHPRRLAVGAIGEVPVRYIAADGEDSDAWRPEETSSCGSCVFCMQKEALGSGRQHQGKEDQELHVPARKVPGSEGAYVGAAIRRYGTAMRAGYSRVLEELQRSWNQSVVQVARALHSVGACEVAGYGFQGLGFRSQKQRWTLQSEKSSLSRSFYESKESTKSRTDTLQVRARVVGRQSISTSSGTESVSEVPASSVQTLAKKKVYDLLNAGPRHRFTVEGKIVSNSYCLTAMGFSRQAKIPIQEAEAHYGEFERRYAGIGMLRQRLWNHMRLNGGQFQNMWGRTRRLPRILSSDKPIRKSSERRAIGSLIQGTAAELTKESIVRADKYKRERGLNFKMCMTVHDEVAFDVPPDEFAETAGGLKYLMESYPEFAPVPIKVGLEFTVTNWAEKRAIKC